MGFYGEKLLPRLTDFALRGEEMDALRARTLATARGRTLEIGFGTGLNARFYPNPVTELVVVDSNPGMSALAEKRAAAAQRAVQHEVLLAEALPFPDASFDTVVVTFALCSIREVDLAIREMRRVLKPDGHLLFLEHNLADTERSRRIQRLLTPAWRRVSGGCHLDRDAPALLEKNGFDLVELEKTRLTSSPPAFGTIRRGIAQRGARNG
jgi:ubiquinone/menaquinone biosynthesis C-methylase UbiE